MGPIVLLAGVLLALYGVATMFAGGVAASTRGADHSRRYAVVVTVLGVVVVLVGVAMIAA